MKTIKTLLPLLFLTIMLCSSTIMSAQTPDDFWSCFEKVARLPQLLPVYPFVEPENTRTLIVMNHGVHIPTLDGHNFETNLAVEVLDKSDILSQGSTEFFLIHEAKCLPEQVSFDMLYYYNFEGNYLHYKTIKANLVLNNGNWTITNYIVE